MGRNAQKLPASIGEIDRELARRSLHHYIRVTDPAYKFNWHHQILIQKVQEWVEGKIKRLIVEMPPRHGKTEIASKNAPAWILGNNPDARIIAASYSSELASSFNREIQRKIETPEFAQIFPNTHIPRSESSSGMAKGYLRNSEMFEIVGRKGYYKSAGVGGPITGMGGKFLLIDDPFKNHEEAQSPTQRRKVWEWYTTTFFTRQETDARIMIVQTRWHEDDLVGKILQNDPNEWTRVTFPAIKLDEYTTEGDPRSSGDVLWPEAFDRNFIETAKRTLGSYQFNALYQQRPAPPEGQIIKASWLKTYTALPEKFDEVIQSWDLSFGTTESYSSFVVGSVYGRKGSQIFMLDRVKGKWNFPETVAQIRMLTAKWPIAIRKLVEKKANGQPVIDTLSGELQGLVPVMPSGSKESRLSAVLPIYEAGNVLYPPLSEAPWVDDHKIEMITFPHAAHDDSVDAETQALAYFALSGVGTLTKDMARLRGSGLGIQSAQW